MGELINVHKLARLLGGWDSGLGGRGDRLARGLRELIVDGKLPTGTRLPSERQLAHAIGVARTTVGNAFDILRDEGALSSRSGVGTFVSSVGHAAPVRGEARLQSYLEPSSQRIDLRSGALPGVPFVADVIAQIAQDDLRAAVSTHGYVAEGLHDLREAIARYYTSDGLKTEPNQILVTTGAQQAIHLIAECFVEPGDAVLVEEPTYRGGIDSFRACGARLYAVQSGPDGVDPELAAAAMQQYRPKFMLLMSTVHNPTGSSLDAARRATLGAAADRFGTTIVDDASTSDTLFSLERPLPMAAHSSNAILVGSASKSFWGGLRIGWVRAERSMLASLIAIKGAEDLGTSIPSQFVTRQLLARIDEARRYRREVLGASLQAVLAELAIVLPEWTPQVPKGGASLWIALPAGTSASTFAEHAQRGGVNILPGPTFSAANELDDHLRISFSSALPLVIEGLHRLAAVWHRTRQKATSPKLVFDHRVTHAETGSNNDR